jgi:Uma2 family endonuclease
MTTTFEVTSQTHWPQPTPPDISDLVIEDDHPVDSLYSEKLQRLLTNALYASFKPGLRAMPTQANASAATGRIPFLVTANVGLFYALKTSPLVPDVMLSLGVSAPANFERREDRTYFVWEMGKPPEVAIEIVSNRKGHELGSKLTAYAHAGVGYYVVYDPLEQLSELNGSRLAIFERQGSHFVPYDSTWMPDVGLGLTLWQGSYEGVTVEWLRWCDQEGRILLTGEERSEQLLELLRAHGITPPES